MQTTLLWKALSGDSLEHCRLEEAERETRVHSSLLGLRDGCLFNLNYQLRLNRRWELLEFWLEGTLDGQALEHRLMRTGTGWLLNGEEAPGFHACTEIDVSFTPLTNTLPIRRLQLREGRSETIRVVYFDLAEKRVGSADQRYTRLSIDRYRFEDLTTGFSAIIAVDEDGLVTEYPLLFERLAKT